MVFADVYLQPDAPDPVLDEHLVVEAARRHAPRAGRLRAVDESGGEARAYLLDGDVVVKTQRPHRLRPRTSLAKEAFVLDELHRLGPFPIPRVLGSGEVAGIEYICLTRVPGSALSRTTSQPDARRRALEDLGRTLRAIHSVEQSALEHSDLVPGDRRGEDLRDRITAAFARLAAAFDADRLLGAVADVRRIAARCLEAIPQDTPPVSLHSNPGPEHTFVDPSSGSFAGLIDFGDAYRSHPALDLRPWPEAGDAEALLAGYRSAGPLSSGFEEVRLAGLVMMEMARAARGRRSPDELSSSLDRLLG